MGCGHTVVISLAAVRRGRRTVVVIVVVVLKTSVSVFNDENAPSGDDGIGV